MRLWKKMVAISNQLFSLGKLQQEIRDTYLNLLSEKIAMEKISIIRTEAKHTSYNNKIK